MANYLKEITITTSNTAKKTPSTKGKNAGTIKKGKRYKYHAVTKDPDDKTGIKKWFKIQTGTDKKGEPVYAYVCSAYCKITSHYVDDNNVKGLKDSNNTDYLGKTNKNEKLKSSKDLDKDIKKMVQNQTKSLETVVDGSMRLFGLPHQLTENNDYRLSKKTQLGTMFTETFMMDAPIIYIKPGKSKFLPGMTTSQKKNMLNTILRAASGEDKSASIAKTLRNMGDKDWRYFEFTADYSGYMTDVNWMCKIGSVFLNLNKTQVPWETKKVTYGAYDWSGYKLTSLFNSKAQMSSGVNKMKDYIAMIKKTLTTVLDDNDYVRFYVDANTSFSESASNSTTSSMISSFMDQLSGIGSELSFVAGVSGLQVDKVVGSSLGSIDSVVNSIAQGDGQISTFLKRLTGVGKQVLTGSNFLAPEIWSDSDYSKSYSFSVTLSSPYGTKEAWYLNVFVPLMHLLCLALPRQTSANTFTSPRLVRVFTPGWFSCDLGIIDSISIEKGGSGDAWTASGLPAEIKVNISVKDLYSNLALPSNYDIKTFFSNTGLINFLMVNCGLDVTKHSLDDKIAVMCNLFMNNLSSTVKETVGEKVETFKEVIRKIFNLFT